MSKSASVLVCLACFGRPEVQASAKHLQSSVLRKSKRLQESQSDVAVIAKSIHHPLNVLAMLCLVFNPAAAFYRHNSRTRFPLSKSVYAGSNGLVLGRWNRLREQGLGMSTEAKRQRRPSIVPPAGFWEAETDAKKSRFIARLAPIKDLDDARKFWREIGDPKASHNVWAAVARNGDSQSSDDGEPGGTSGMPMRQVLEKNGYVGVVVVVTRYYGGIKLGGGGLVRAYSGACRAVVDVADWEEVREASRVSVSGVPPAKISSLYQIASGQQDVEMVGDMSYDANGCASATLSVTKESVSRICAELEALARGEVKIQVQEVSSS